MLTLELVSKRRKPIKRLAIGGILAGVLLLVFIALTGQSINHSVKIVLMLVIACIFIICLFIINYSVKFKNSIGRISLYNDRIDIEFLQRTETILLQNMDNIKFKLTGYEGLNNSSVLDYMMWSPSFFSYHSGMNNFIYFRTNSGFRKFEFYIPNKQVWLMVHKMAKLYLDYLQQK